MKYKNCLIYVLAVIMLNGCAATKNNLNVLYTEKQLLKDIDFVHRKLQKLHPQLYWYISKKALDEKFDSLKSSIRAPMTADEFYFKLSPVVSSIRQGHTRLFRNTKSDQKGSGFEYEIFDHKLYIVKNYSARADIKPGTEVVSINNTSPQAILEKYGNTFSSDGFNQTFKDRILCQTFEKSLSFENIRPDSVVYQLKYNDTIRNVSLYNTTSDSVKTTKNIQAYDTDLKFMGRDSSVALMKISSFAGFHNGFYHRSFEKISELKSKVLILDLRDNLGGRLKDAYNLYSYLTDDYFYFIDKPEICSRTSLLNTGKFRNSRMLEKIFMVAFTPLRLTEKWYMLYQIDKGPDDKYYYDLDESDMGEPNPNNFKGKVYVIINGGCFSAACLLASNLKGSGRAFFVGEETGGSFNGTVAGMIPRLKLPNSKLQISIGMAVIKPHYQINISGHGIYPDVEIKPTIQDRIQENDPELQWILKDIEKHDTEPIDPKNSKFVYQPVNSSFMDSL